MEHYAGLDVSLKEVSICVIDRDGKIVSKGTCPAHPDGVAGWLKTRDLEPCRIVHESGMLAIWLQRGLARLGLPAICIDYRKAHESLATRLNKPMLVMLKAWHSWPAWVGTCRSISAVNRRTDCAH